tara:strand:+ start:28 stop:411 length:384 start_codon:yes stop_codon:yes gene_type:complete
MDFSNYLENKLIDATVRGVGYSTTLKVYMALFKTNPTKANIGIEVTGASYTRPNATFVAPVDGVSRNSGQISYAVATTDWGEAGWVGIMDSKEGGNLLYFAALDFTKNILTGDQLKFKPNEITLTLT